MKLTSLLCVIALCAAAPGAHAQIAIVTASDGGVQEIPLGISVTQSFLGKPVYDAHDRKVGMIKDLIMGLDGSIAYLIVGPGPANVLAHQDMAVELSELGIRDDKLILIHAVPGTPGGSDGLQYINAR
jgi:sporulation protein YlmC with PRC-barrel domain